MILFSKQLHQKKNLEDKALQGLSAKLTSIFN